MPANATNYHGLKTRNFSIFALTVVVYSIIFITLEPKFGSVVTYLVVFPVLILSWLEGRLGAIIAVMIMYGLAPLLVTVLNRDPLLVLLDPVTTIGTIVLCCIGLIVGYSRHLNNQLHTEISKRKELEQLLEQKNAKLDELLSENRKYSKRVNTEMESQISNLKSALRL